MNLRLGFYPQSSARKELLSLDTRLAAVLVAQLLPALRDDSKRAVSTQPPIAHDSNDTRNGRRTCFCKIVVLTRVFLRISMDAIGIHNQHAR